MLMPCFRFILTICSCNVLCTAERDGMHMHVVTEAVFHALFQNVRLISGPFFSLIRILCLVEVNICSH
jgi:hypothetical protein